VSIDSAKLQARKSETQIQYVFRVRNMSFAKKSIQPFADNAFLRKGILRATL